MVMAFPDERKNQNSDQDGRVAIANLNEIRHKNTGK